MDTKIFPATGFRHEFNAEELYVITTHWLSDIVFFEQEIHYFQSLITRYFLPLVEEEHILLIKSLQNQLKKLDTSKNQLRANIIAHQAKLTVLFDQQHDNEAYHSAEHSKSEEQLQDFIKNLKQVKLEFFNATKFTGQTKNRA